MHPDLKTALIALQRERGDKVRHDLPIPSIAERDKVYLRLRSLSGFTGCMRASG